jgi:hypothetical protein
VREEGVGKKRKEKEEEERTKNSIQKPNLIPPIPMYTLLSLREKETLSRIETSPNSLQSTVFPCDLYNSV